MNSTIKNLGEQNVNYENAKLQKQAVLIPRGYKV